MSNVPKLRFKEFSGEWNKERFGELCGFEQGVQVDVELQTKEQSDDLVRFIRIENYTQNSSDFRFIPKELAKKKSIDEKEIAIVRYGATAGFIGRGFSGVLANNLFKLKPNHKLLDDEYLYHYLKSYKAFHFFQSEMAGGAMPALSFGIVKALKLPYPSKQEQENIASFLTSVDTKIEQLTKKEQLLSSYKKGVMQKIFNQEIRFKADDGSEFCDWGEKKLDDILKTVSTKLYQIKNSDILSEGLFKVVDQGQKTIAGYSNDTEKVYSSGDIIVYGDHTTIVKYIDFDFIVGADGTKLLNTTKDNNLKYMYYNLVFNNIEAEGYKRHFSILRNIALQIPSLKEQIKIANFLSSIDSKIEQVQKQLDSTKEFKKALLQEMFI